MGEGGVFRSLKFARYLPDFGWTPVVLSADPRSYWIHDYSLLEELPGDCRVTRTVSPSGLFILNTVKSFLSHTHLRKSPPHGSRTGGKSIPAGTGVRSRGLFSLLRFAGDFLLFPDTYIAWYPFAVRKGSALFEEMDITALYSTSPPDTNHLVAKSLARRHAVPWIADFRDPWVATHFRNPPTPLHRWIHDQLENAVLKHSCVVTTTAALQEHLSKTTGKGHPVHLIRNGYDPADFESVAPGEVESRTPDSKEFLIVYTGKMTGTRVSDGLLKGLRILVETHREIEGRLCIRFIGSRENRVDRLIEKHRLSNLITLQPYTSHRTALEWQKAADLLLILKHDDPRYHSMIPGKFYEYAGSRTPILAVARRGELTDLIEKYSLGYHTDPRDPVAVADMLWKIYCLWLDGKLRVPFAPPPDFQRPYQAWKLAEILNNLIEGNAG
jgi:glycosyltransferase involved in cell wall biosynthesis